MAKTIANFLVGVGLDTKDFDKGSRSVDTALSGFRSKAGAAGAGIAAAFTAAGVAALKFGEKADRFVLDNQKWDTAARSIYNLGNAYRMMRGNAADAYSDIAKAEAALDALKRGESGFLDAAGLSRVDIASLQYATSGEDLLMRLSALMEGRNGFQQRTLADSIGLSTSGFNALSKGPQTLQAAIDSVHEYSSSLEAAAKANREYAEQMAKLGIRLDDIGYSLAKEILPSFASIVRGINEILDNNRARIEGVINVAADKAGSLAAVGAGVGTAAGASAVGALASKLGLNMAARAAAGVGTAGWIGAAVGAGSALYDLSAKDIESVTGWSNVGKYYRSPKETVEALMGWQDKQGVDPRNVSGLEYTEPAGIPIPKEDYSWFWRSGAVSAEDAAQFTPSAQQYLISSKPSRAFSDESVPKTITIDNKLYLDGREIGKFVRQVNAEDYYQATSAIESTVDR